MKNRYADSSTRPHSALVGSPFRNVVKRFDADITKQHHIHSVASAKPTIQDQPEPIFATILERRGYDPSSGSSFQHNSDTNNQSHSSPSGRDYFNARLSPMQQRGGDHSHHSPIASSSSFSQQRNPGASSTSFQTSLSSPSAGATPSVKKDMSIAAATGSSDYKHFSGRGQSPKRKQYIKTTSSSPHSSPSSSPRRAVSPTSSSVFMAHKQKSRERATTSSAFSPSPVVSKQRQNNNNNLSSNIGSSIIGGNNSSNNNISVSDAKLFRAPSTGMNASAEFGFAGNNNPRSSSPNNNNSASRGGGRPNSGGGSKRRVGGGGGNNNNNFSSSMMNSNNNANRPQFGTTSNYQRWSQMSPSQVANSANGLLGGELFAVAMKGAQSQMDDAETLEVRREVQGAIDSFLYRPVARRFSEETAKWVEDHILPFAQTQHQGGDGGGGFSPNRPGSAATQQSDDSKDSGRLGGVGFASGGNDNANHNNSIASRRQRALAMTEEVLPLMFHHIASEIRNAVRLRIEAALLKKETRTSYL